MSNGLNGHHSSVNGHASVPRRFRAVMLAGALQPSPLRQQLHMPVLCLPMTARHRLLDLWLSVIAAQGQYQCDGVTIVVSSRADADQTEALLESYRSLPESASCPVRVRIDPKDWRGPAGLVRDIADEVGMVDDALMLVAEAACLPPIGLCQMFRAMDDEVMGMVAGGQSQEPAGVYLFRREAIDCIPTVGFYDIKEQALPALYERGLPVRMAATNDPVIRLRDRGPYLTAIGEILRREPKAAMMASDVSVSASAYVSSGSLIHDGVTVSDGAIVHESIVLPGAVISGGAVVSQSIIGPGVRVAARSTVRSDVLAMLPSRETGSEPRSRPRADERAADLTRRVLSGRWAEQ